MPSSTSSLPSWLRLAAVSTLLGFTTGLHAADWRGADGKGGDGSWVGANFDPIGFPNSSAHLYFDGINIDDEESATVTIGTGVNAVGRSLTVRNNKRVILQLGENASLAIGQASTSSNALNVGGTPNVGVTDPSTTYLRIEASDGANATARISRLYLEGNSLNVGTEHTKSLVLSGSGLIVTLNRSFSAVAGKSTITLEGGVTVLTEPLDEEKNNFNGAGSFYIRTGKENDDVYENHLRVLDGSLSAFYIRAEGLLQLGRDGAIGTSAAASTGPLNIVVRRSSTSTPGGRFEAEGSGLAADVQTLVQTTGTFAVGLSDPWTGVRSGAAELALQSGVTFESGSLLELGIFGSDAEDADRIAIGSTGGLSLGSGNARLVLKLHGGFVPQAGDEWQLFTVDPLNPGAITGSFNLSGIDTAIWDLSRFNAEGGWILASAIPEPGSISLLAVAAVAAVGLGLRRKNR